MSKVLVSKEKLDTLSETIKTKTNKTNNLTIDEMNEAVENIASGDIEINGLIKQYQVYAGENISAGDFVEYLNSVYKDLVTSQYAGNTFSAVLLETNKIFVAYTRNNYLYGVIVTINGMTITSNQTSLYSSKNCYNGPYCVLLETNKVFIAHGGSSSYDLYGTIVTINGTSMTYVSSQLNSESYSTRGLSCILLEANKIFIAHSYSSSYCLSGTIVTIDGTNMTAVSSVLNSDANSCYGSPSCVLLESNKVFIANMKDTSNSKLSGTIVTIDGTNMTAVSSVLNSDANSCNYKPSCILVAPNKVFIAHNYGTNTSTGYHCLSGTIVTIDGTNMTAVFKILNNTNYSHRANVGLLLLETNKVYISHGCTSSEHLYGETVEIDGTDMNVTKVDVIDTGYNSGGKECFILESGDMFILQGRTSTVYLAGRIYLGDQVKPYESNILGVAKSSGAGGDIIDVVVPNT